MTSWNCRRFFIRHSERRRTGFWLGTEQCRLKLKSFKEKQLRNQNLSDKSGEGYHEEDTIDEKLDALLSNQPDENPVHVLQSENCFVLPVQESMHELKYAASLDLAQGSHQLPAASDVLEMTAFIVGTRDIHAVGTNWEFWDVMLLMDKYVDGTLERLERILSRT
ncbi:unnamed protein product [Mytilus edulis]|uniref:Uncharacterized protein n=1 Tax=Mytilus edulis TaxID=6550 RepID=A0A8S3T1Q6_MYTED|nr:unnamed protein product [Mytilus edulis]